MGDRILDLICMGRSSVDLYGEQLGGRLEDMQSFRKYVGGCPTNIAVGTARLGLRSALITRVGDEHMGRFIREQLAAEGVETSQVRSDPERLTALVSLGIRDRDTFPLIFYRENCADMALTAEEDVDPAFIATAKALLVTGTHFSRPNVDRACRAAMAAARAAGTKVMFDIDYRPVLWGLTGHGLGIERYVSSAETSRHLQTIVADCDLVVGTEEEFHILGGSEDTLQALKVARALTRAILVLKRGPAGCVVYDGAIPDTLDGGLVCPGFPVEVMNVLGAGDAFYSGFLSGWLRGMDLAECAKRANACGALVVSRHGCAPAMPSTVELEDFLTRAAGMTRPDRDARLDHLHRATNRRRQWPKVTALAFDHRAQFETLCAKVGADPARIPKLKSLIAAAVERTADGAEGCGVLIDDRYGEDVLAWVSGRGWWIGRPVEQPGSRPLAFEAGDPALAMRSWPAEHVAKCLVFYHPEDPEALRNEQIASLLRLQRACNETEHDLLIEVIPPASMPSDELILARAVGQLYDAGLKPDWWKLPPSSAAGWAALAEVVERNDPHCRGVLLLGLEAPEEVLDRAFQTAVEVPLCKGFAIGRSIFWKPSEQWLAGEIDDEGCIRAVSAAYRGIIDLWHRRPRPVAAAG